MQTILKRLLTAAALVVLMAATALPAGADNSGGPPGPSPVPSGEEPPIDETGPPISDPSAFGSNCIRIDLLPGYGPNLTLQYSYDIVIMSDGITNAIYFGASAGDTIFTSSGSGLVYVIKCGFGGFGTYSQGEVTFLVAPVTSPAAAADVPQDFEFTLDGCQPGATAEVSLDNGRSQSFVVPPEGFLTATIVGDPDTPAPVLVTAECNGFEVTGPADEDGLALLVAAGVDLPGDTPADGDDTDSAAVGPDQQAAAPVGERADSEVVVASASAPSPAAIADAASTDGAVAITLAVTPDRTFSLGDLALTNPAAVQDTVEVSGGPAGDEYAVVSEAVDPAIIDAAAGSGTGSSPSSTSVLRVGVGGVAALGLVAFTVRRRLGSRLDVRLG